MTTPRRPRRCGGCTMFGHDRRACYLLRDRNGFDTSSPTVVYSHSMNNWNDHCRINTKWIAAGGAGIDIPEPQPPKTPFEQACDNTCKVTHTDECCICMEALGEKNKVVTSCGHQFHFGCLIQDTNRSNKCPMCRAIIRPELPKRELSLPGTAAIRRMSVRTADLHLHYSHLPHSPFFQRTLAQIMAESSMIVLNDVRRRNE